METSQIVEDLSETLSLGFEDAHLLLVSYRYKAERAMDAYFESPDTTLAAAGLTIKPGSSGPCGSSGDARPDFPNGTSATDTFECAICMDCFPFKDGDALPCSDWLCNDCWKAYVQTQFRSGKTAAVLSTCSACGERMRARIWNKYLPKRDAARLSERQTQHYVEQTSATRSCPGVGCKRLATYPKRVVREIQCHCGTQWCFGCGHEWHSPLTCQEIQAWMSTSGKHSEDLQWILANSKPCPRCNRPIEKNEGCKHMTCGKDGSPGCGYDFCWVRLA